MGRVIDLEHHFGRGGQSQTDGGGKKPIGVERGWGKDGKIYFRTIMKTSPVEAHLQFMDEAGIDIAVVTSNTFTPNLDRVKEVNDSNAKIINDNPKRFVGFAAAAPLAGKPGLDEIERAVKNLGMKGVQISTVVEGRHLDSNDLWPFYEKVSELGVPIDVHITDNPPGFDALHAPYALYYVLTRELDMCATVMRVCLGGILEDFPDLKFIMNHFGGGISAVKDRFDAYIKMMGYPTFYRDKRLISKPYTDYFDKLYFNMAGREGGMASVNCALTNINPKKLLFATDWPLNYTNNNKLAKQFIDDIKKLPLPKADIDGMLGENVAKLIGI